MTCGALPTLSHDSARSPTSTKRLAVYARLPDDIDERVARDTICLHDSSFALPDRSTTRRRVFQNLQNRYYRQILYGCTNPRCEVPTCLSRQKGVSKGPFRPYTVLSARSLASFLASQDQPEKGLCPHEPINAPALCGPKPTPQANHHGGNLPRVLGDLSRSQETYSCSESSNNGVVEGPFPTVNATIQFGNLSAPKLGEEVSVNDNGKNATDKPENGSGLCKVKDMKSFAQSLFDTAAMKVLHIGDVPEDCLGWMRRSQADQRDGISSDANSQKPSPSGGRLHPAVNVSISEKADRNESTAPAESTGKINDTCEIQTEDVPQERTLPCLDLDGAINADPDFMVSVDSESRSEFRSNNRRLGEVPVARVVQPNRLEEDHPTTEHRSQGPVPKGSKCKFADGVVSEPHSPDEVDEDEGKVQTLSNGVEYSALASPQSLSHFSIANIKGLAESLERKHYDINLKHRLSNLQGRIDSPFHFIGSSKSQAESYWAFLAFSAQSLTYVLGNTEALMRSFLHCDLVNSSRTIIQPYELPLMVSCFQILRSLDFHPQTILPSLWISAGFIYPFNFSRRNIPSNIAGILLSKGLRGSLNDLEASHIVKIVFAALVATVPTYNNMTIMNAVCKLRGSGLTAPLPRVTDPSEQRELHSKVLNAAVAFEDEMALNVAKRLVRAIMARQQRSQSLQGYDRDGCAHQSYLCNTVDYLLKGKTEIIVADNQVSQSVKGGKIIEQVKSELAENLDFPCRVVVEWLRAVIIKEWDGQAKVRKDSALAGALGLMREFALRSLPGIEEDFYQTPYLSDRLDFMEVPLEWVSCNEEGAFVHLLSYPFLFAPSVLISYFRAINYNGMSKAFEGAKMAYHLASRMTFTDPRTNRGAIRVQTQLRIAQARYFVLEVRREDLLADAMNQLWRRQKRELMRPLKVCIGSEEGEEGFDLGGVQQEFFRVAVAEALDPKYGAFTTDSETHMSWFQPGSLEPLYKFEILGLLTSLAVYNGLTLPFSFPRAFYGHLLGRPPTALTDIEDGWPRLAKGLRDLRDWPKNDVEEVFSRQFVYSVPFFGTTLDVEMAKPQDGFSRRRQKPLHRSVKEQFGKNGAVPEESRGANTALSEGTVSQITNHKELGQTSEKVPTNSAPELNERHFSDSSRLPYDQGEASHEYNFPSNLPRGNTNPEQEPMMVTNENREEYIRKYIAHLTDYSIRDQRIAFERGFFTCISRKSITLFTPSQLKALIEGLPDIDVNGLERVTKYEGGFHPKHPTIRHFWAVVRKWSQENIRKLLEFVTASDRLPTGGVGRVNFAIQKNGLGDGERLPTSMTCFGKLLLPEYDSEEMLRRGLEIAVENSKGFGQF